MKFSEQRGKIISADILDTKCLVLLVYLAQIFNYLTGVKISMQGRNGSIPTSMENLLNFLGEKIWKRESKEKVFRC
jgi:hypothetical protein